jgi:hypothetical protein
MLVQIAFISKKKELWVLGSGCPNHMMGDKDKHLKLEDYEGGFVQFGDNFGT